MAPTGTFPVRLGKSFRASSPSSSSRLHTFRCTPRALVCVKLIAALKDNFKPEGISRSEKGQLRKNDNTGAWRAVFPSEAGDVAFNGTQTTGVKRTEALLIFDEATNSFVLERIASSFQFDLERRVGSQQSLRAAPSSAAKRSAESSPRGSDNADDAHRAKERNGDDDDDEMDSEEEEMIRQTEESLLRKNRELEAKTKSADRRPRTLDGRILGTSSANSGENTD